MLKKTYGLIYRNKKWHIRNYGREIKTGVPMIGLRARVTAWARNRRGEGKIIELKRIVPRPGPKEDYVPAQEMIKEIMGSSRPMKVSYDDQDGDPVQDHRAPEDILSLIAK